MKTKPVSAAGVHSFVDTALGENFCAKCVLSVANAFLGTLSDASFAIYALGLALATVGKRKSKHAIKQVDRLLSNQGIDVWTLVVLWVLFVVGEREKIGKRTRSHTLHLPASLQTFTARQFQAEKLNGSHRFRERKKADSP